MIIGSYGNLGDLAVFIVGCRLEPGLTTPGLPGPRAPRIRHEIAHHNGQKSVIGWHFPESQREPALRSKHTGLSVVLASNDEQDASPCSQ
jgi:hypothetical protein